MDERVVRVSAWEIDVRIFHRSGDDGGVVNDAIDADQRAVVRIADRAWPAPRPEPKKTALKTEVAKNAPTDDQSDAGKAAGSAGVVGAGQAGTGPVRLGSGGNITLLKKVQPVYPGALQSARVPGQVMLDAIIHADGTIGDITVLRSTNDAFARSAIDAVKQWKYAPIGFEAILTVTVNFTMA
jgi:TonB family protein